MPEIALTQTSIHLRHGSNIGQPLTRRDGVLKVTGAAKYAGDHHPRGMLYAVLAVSSMRGAALLISMSWPRRRTRAFIHPAPETRNKPPVPSPNDSPPPQHTLGSLGRKRRSRKPTRPQGSITIQWSRMRLLPCGRAIRFRSIRRAKV